MQLAQPDKFRYDPSSGKNDISAYPAYPMTSPIELILALALAFTLIGVTIVLIRLTRQPSVRSLEVDVMRLAAARAVGVSLAARLELNALLDLIVRQSIGLVGATSGVVYLFERESSTLRLAAAYGLPASYSGDQPMVLGTDLAKQAALSGQTLNIAASASSTITTGNPLPSIAVAAGFPQPQPLIPYTAAVAVPLKFGSEVVGVVAVFEWAPGRAYAEADVIALELLAPQAAIAIMNARSFQELKTTQATLTAQIDELTMLERVDQELNATLNLESVLILTVDWALRRTGARAGTVFVTTPDGTALIPITTLGYPAGALPFNAEHPAPLDWGIVGRAARTRQTCFVPNVTKDADYIPLLPNVCAQVAVPLEVQERLLGVLSLESDHLAAFSRENLGFIDRLAARSSIALDNARLYRESERLADDVSALYAAGRSISSSLDQKEILARTAQAIAALLDASSALLTDYQPDQGQVSVLAGYRLGTAQNTAESRPPDGTIWTLESVPALRQTLQERQACLLSRADPTLTEPDRQWLQTLGATAVLIAPLLALDEPIGLLVALEGRRDRQFTYDEQRLCEALVSQAAIALRQAQLYEEVRELESLKSEMINMASHDLRGPLGNAMGYFELLVGQLGSTLSAQQQGFVSNVRQSFQSMKTLIDDLLSLEKIESEQQTSRESFALDALVKEVCDEQQSAADLKHQTLITAVPDESLMVVGNPLQLRQAVVNLVSNAIKYTPNDGKITVRLHTADQQFRFEVIDTGYGISLERQARLFHRFYRAKQPGTEQIPGTGLGLSLVKAIIVRHGGDVWVKSAQGMGSTFGFWLPHPPPH